MTLAPIRPDLATPKFVPPAAGARCPDYSWCEGSCLEAWTENDDARYHGSDFHSVAAAEMDRGDDQQISVSTVRIDAPGEPSDVAVHLLMGKPASYQENWSLTAANARRLAALLLNGADNIDPLPLGETSIQAQYIRVGDEILTDDGWQRVYQTLIDGNNDYAAAFTPERHGEDTDGWVFKFADPVRIRRPMLPGAVESPTDVRTINAEGIRYGDHLLTGDGWQKVVGLLVFEDSDQVNIYTPEQDDERTDGWQFSFGEAVQVRRTMPDTYEAPGWCSRCRTERTITGRRLVSSNGVARIRGGRCRTCGKGKLNVLLEHDGTLVPGARRIAEVTV